MSINIHIEEIIKSPNNWQQLKLESKYEQEKLIFEDSLIYCDNLNDLSKYLEKIRIPQMSNNWIFRGINNYKYNLSTSLERIVEKEQNRYNKYVDLFIEFKSAAYNFLNTNQIPEIDDILEWEALMQHHGCPTRLLDWTDSPYIALFFALDGIPKKQDENNYSSIWCLNETLLTIMCRDEFNRRKLKNIHSNFNYRLFNQKEIFNIIHKEALNQSNWGFILPIKPKRKNMRLLSQQGSFTLFGNIRFDFEYNLKTLFRNAKIGTIRSHDLIKMIIIPQNLKDEINSYLFSVNITKRTLFPGIDGFSQSLIQYIEHGDYKKKNMDPWFSIDGKVPFK